MKKENKSQEWELKDRTYYLLDGSTPITFTLASKHSRHYPLMWFDEEAGYGKELKYASNQKSPIVEEQKGYCTLEHIVFRDGTLFVPKNKQNLQKLLSIYHPYLGKIYGEIDVVADAVEEVDVILLQVDAMNAARDMDVDHAEAVLRVEFGSSVSNLASKEIKRDVLVFARNNPKLFMELVADDNVTLRNFAIKAVEAGIVRLDDDQRTFKWKSNGRKLMTVPFDENPYSAMAAFFKTDDGIEIYKSIEKKFK
jgi:hypothetical protein